MHMNRPSQILGLQCACCGQTYNPATAAEDALEVKIFGTDKYAECAVCGLNVPDELRGSSYEKRWRVAMERHLGSEEFRLLIALSMMTRMKSSPETDALFDVVLRKLQVHYPGKTLPELIEGGDRLCALL